MNPRPGDKPRVAAVSFLNTVPLVWGMLHGRQRDLFDIDFCLPSECARRLETGAADIGIVPAVELPRLGLEVIRGAGIACRGAVRSILLVSKTPLREIRTLAADSSSRTSVMLARIILAERYGAEPRISSHAPDLGQMLGHADAALVIGDPALRIDPDAVAHRVVDLGEEWFALTGKPMVFAVWAAQPDIDTAALAPAFADSLRQGLGDLDLIVRQEATPRGLSEALARDYLTRRITFELGESEIQGLELFLEYAGRAVPV